EALPPFHQRLVNSMFTLSTQAGLSAAQLTKRTSVANFGFSDIAFPKPLFHGDTMYPEKLVTDKLDSQSRPAAGIATLATRGGHARPRARSRRPGRDRLSAGYAAQM